MVATREQQSRSQTSKPSPRPVTVPESLLFDLVLISKLAQCQNRDEFFLAQLALIAGTKTTEILGIDEDVLIRMQNHIANRVDAIGYT